MKMLAVVVLGATLASVTGGVVFAASPMHMAAVTQGKAIDQCRAQEGLKEKHAFIERQACVQRLERTQS